MPGEHLGAGQLQGGQPAMSLVEVDDAGVDPHRAQSPHGADPEQRVLGETNRPVGDVQPAGDPAVDPPVLRPFGVEEIERGPAHLHAPDLDHHLAATEGHRDGERGAVRPEHQGGGETLGVHRPPVLVLVPAPIGALQEVPLSIEEADPDHGEGQVGGLLEDVPGQHAQPPGVDGQRAVDTELGAEEGDGMPLGRPARQRRTGQLGGEPAQHRLGAADQQVIADRPLQRLRGGLGEEADRIAVAELPALGIDGLEEILGIRVPGPQVVVGDLGEGGEPRRQTLGKGAGRRRDVGTAVEEWGRRRQRLVHGSGDGTSRAKAAQRRPAAWGNPVTLRFGLPRPLHGLFEERPRPMTGE